MNTTGGNNYICKTGLIKDILGLETLQAIEFMKKYTTLPVTDAAGGVYLIELDDALNKGSWEEAHQDCERRLQGWRLPTPHELDGIRFRHGHELNRISPARTINGEQISITFSDDKDAPRPGRPKHILWTDRTHDDFDGMAYAIDTGNGLNMVFSKSCIHCYKLVRTCEKDNYPHEKRPANTRTEIVASRLRHILNSPQIRPDDPIIPVLNPDGSAYLIEIARDMNESPVRFCQAISDCEKMGGGWRLPTLIEMQRVYDALPLINLPDSIKRKQIEPSDYQFWTSTLYEAANGFVSGWHYYTKSLLTPAISYAADDLYSSNLYLPVRTVKSHE
jgi:hypothetical protein